MFHVKHLMNLKMLQNKNVSRETFVWNYCLLDAIMVLT